MGIAGLRWLGFFFRCYCFGLFRPLDALQARRLALQLAQVIQLGAADATLAQYFDRTDGWRIDREDALDSNSKADAAHRETCARRFSTDFDHDAFERLDAFLLTFALFQADMNPDCITRPQRRQVFAYLCILKFLNDAIHGF